MSSHKRLRELQPLSVDQLLDLLVEQQKKGNGCHKVMLRFTGSDEIEIGARLVQVAADGFYKHVNLVGPNLREDEEP